MSRSEKIAMGLWVGWILLALPFMPAWGKYVATLGMEFSIGMLLAAAPMLIPMYLMAGYSFWKMLETSK